MERASISAQSIVNLALGVVVILIGLLALSYVIGVCAGAAHLGYEWVTS